MYQKDNGKLDNGKMCHRKERKHLCNRGKKLQPEIWAMVNKVANCLMVMQKKKRQ